MTAKFTTGSEGLTLVLPAEILSHLQAADGVELQVVETPSGVTLQRAAACEDQTETAKQVEIAMEVMERRRDALRRLAE